MLPAGYLAKRIWVPPPGFDCPQITEVYSVATCLSEDFGDYSPLFRHNEYGIFDSEAAVRAAAAELRTPLEGTRMLYFEVHPEEWHDEDGWMPLTRLATEVEPPVARQLEGFDVACASSGAGFECSPLTCNGLARKIETNARGLLPTLERARQLLESGAFRNSEPGPYRIVAVYSVPPTP